MTVSERFDCSDPGQRSSGIQVATAAVRRGDLVVLPTDTVYGIGADAFTPEAVAALMAAKGRGRSVPVPVLVGSLRMLHGVVEGLGESGQALVETFWPGGLTLVCRHPPHLAWDLGDARGTVAVRMPSHQVALELLAETGPMAVSSANRHGSPPPVTCDEAFEQLGEHAGVYLDGGPCAERLASTIIDITSAAPRVLREGAVSLERVREVVGSVVTGPEGEGAPGG